jgi:phosphate transport system protein
VSSHLEEQLQRDIDQIRNKVRQLADLALRALEDAVVALTRRDAKLAYEAILRDSRIDDLESAIDAECVEFMVRHIPVAKNLRFAHSVAKIVVELERIGDYAESINRQAILLSQVPWTPDLEKFAELANVSIEMLKQSMRAFLDEDEILAARTRQLDSLANRLHQEIFLGLSARVPANTEELSTLFALLSVANRFERVADQAKNVCDEVAYIVTGVSVKHKLERDVYILFVSTERSCRGLIAEQIGRKIGGDRFAFSSSGLGEGAPEPRAVRFLSSKGIDIRAWKPTKLSEIGDLSRYKAVVTIGPEAAATVPKRLGFRTIRLEWDVPDPSTAAGASSDDTSAYAAVFDDLVSRITELIRDLHGTVATVAATGSSR